VVVFGHFRGGLKGAMNLVDTNAMAVTETN